MYCITFFYVPALFKCPEHNSIFLSKMSGCLSVCDANFMTALPVELMQILIIIIKSFSVVNLQMERC